MSPIQTTPIPSSQIPSTPIPSSQIPSRASAPPTPRSAPWLSVSRFFTSGLVYSGLVCSGLIALLWPAAPALAQPGESGASGAEEVARQEEAAQAEGAQGQPVAAGSTKGGAWLERARDRVRSRRVPFWRQEAVVADIGLNQAQLEEIEQLHKVFHKKRLELGRNLRQSGPDIAAALALGDWQAARQLTAGKAEATAEQTTLETELKIQVLKGLTAEQRKALLDRHRHLLQLPWLVAPPSSHYPAGRGGPLRRDSGEASGEKDGGGDG